MTLISCKTDTLKITIDEDYEGEAYLYNTVTYKIDTISSSIGTFSFNAAELENPTLYYLMFKGINQHNRPIYLILSNKGTEIKFNELVPVSYNSSNIKGLYPNKPLFLADPNSNQEFYVFQDLWINFYNEVSNPDLSYDDRKMLHSEFIAQSEEIIRKNSDKLVSAFIIEYLMINNLIKLEKIQSLYSDLSPDIHNSIIARKIKNEVGLEKRSLAPKFTFRDYQGNNYSLDSMKGKKVLLHFWSTTCAPCLKEIPELLQLAKENDELVILNISLDTDSIRWVSGMEKLGIIDMINFCDFKGNNGKITKDYKIRSIPANYLIDEEGKILSKKESLDSLVGTL